MAMTVATTISLPGDTKLALSDSLHKLHHENVRLRQLVAELLLRNQQLRNDNPDPARHNVAAHQNQLEFGAEQERTGLMHPW